MFTDLRQLLSVVVAKEILGWVIFSFEEIPDIFLTHF